jgi:hypothetical protein
MRKDYAAANPVGVKANPQDQARFQRLAEIERQQARVDPERERIDRLIKERREQEQAAKVKDKRDIFGGLVKRDPRDQRIDDRIRQQRDRLLDQRYNRDQRDRDFRLDGNRGLLDRRLEDRGLDRRPDNRLDRREGGWLDNLLGRDQPRGDLPRGGVEARGALGPNRDIGLGVNREEPGFLAKLKNMFGDNGGELVARGVRQPQALRAAQLAVGQLERESLAGLLASINKLAPILGPVKAEKLLRHTRESIINELDKKCLANGLTLFDEVAGECVGVVDAFAEVAKASPVPQPPRFNAPRMSSPVRPPFMNGPAINPVRPPVINQVPAVVAGDNPARPPIRPLNGVQAPGPGLSLDSSTATAPAAPAAPALSISSPVGANPAPRLGGVPPRLGGVPPRLGGVPRLPPPAF